MHAHYDRTPVVEAIIECFVHPRRWSPISADRLTKQFSLTYQGKPELIRQLGVEMRIGPDGPSARPIDGPADRLRIWNADKTRMVQFGADMCAVNVLPPYESFPTYLPEFKKLFSSFVEEGRPERLRALGQRYLNRVQLPDASADPCEYFEIYPRRVWGSEVHPPMGLQLQMAKLPHGVVMATLAFQRFFDGKPEYLLDLYARSGDDPPIEVEWTAVEAWHLQAHEALFEAFEATLAPAARTLLGRREPS